MTYLHSVYGLILQLPFLRPELEPAPPASAPDVIVEYGEVPRELPTAVLRSMAGKPVWQAEHGRFLLRGGMQAGRFLVERGRHILIERAPQAEDDKLAAHLMSTVMAAILRQRGLLVIHGDGALMSDGSAIVIAGVSGAGKSTTVAALLARGWGMLTNDIVALEKSDGGEVRARPGLPRLHLCDDAAERLGRNTVGLPRYALRHAKSIISAGAGAASGPAPIRAVYLLRTCQSDDLQVQGLHGGAKFSALQEAIYGPLLPGDLPVIFPIAAAVAEQAAVYLVERPAGRWTAEEIADRIRLQHEG